jgi:hypothetical protein
MITRTDIHHKKDASTVFYIMKLDNANLFLVALEL